MLLREMKRRTIIGLVLIGLLVNAAAVSAELRKEGSTAPDFTLQTLKGKPVSLSDLRGKPVVLEFWATWCGPCRKQFPKMSKVHERYDDRVHFIMVNTAESVAKVQEFGKRVEIPGTVLMDPDDRVGELYGTKILPSLFFIDGSGTIQAAIPGTVGDVEEFMERMMREVPTGTPGEPSH